VTGSQAAGKNEGASTTTSVGFARRAAAFGVFKSGALRAITPSVECWIGVMTEGGRRVVRVVGSLRIAHIPELLVACADSAALEIDLSDLISADVAGIEALQRIRAKGAVLVGMHGYIKLKIDSVGTQSE
jgi:hypothetical protein